MKENVSDTVSHSVDIREVDASEMDVVWPIFHAVVAPGDTYAYPPTTSFEEAKALWFERPHRVFTASVGGRVVGTYHMKPNHIGLGSHVANAGYMVDPAYRGRGIASAMCEHSLEIARAAGFRAMQFNCVVSTNERAVALWQRHGFKILARVPEAFLHPSGAFVDIFVMHRFL